MRLGATGAHDSAARHSMTGEAAIRMHCDFR